MGDLNTLVTDLAWPLTLLLAWLAGEFGHRWSGLPRISIYAVVGFVLASTQIGLLPSVSSNGMLLLANIAFGLILFECGHRINLQWLRANPWLGVTSLAESVLTFAAVFAVARWFEATPTTAYLLAALSMATSPAAVVRVIIEERNSGQVTERVLHLAAMNSVMAVFVFKVVVGMAVFQTSGNVWDATYSSLIVLSASVVLGALMGILMPALLRNLRRTHQDSTLAFALAIIFLVVLTHSLKLSPVLATLTFGLVARHRRIVLNPSQRGFGALGDLFAVLLFVFIGAALDWEKAVVGIEIGLAIVVVRLIAKIAGISMFAHLSGISWRKGVLLGVAMTPLSTFVILVLEQTRHLGIDLIDQLAPLAAAALVLEILGPILVQRALIWVRETPNDKVN